MKKKRLRARVTSVQVVLNDEDGVDRTLPTPQHEWEPPREIDFGDGFLPVINARWRLALMGYPLDWLDVPDAAIAALPGAPADPRKRAKWWNKQGVIATGNAQAPQNVALLMRGMREVMLEYRDERRKAVAS